MTNGVNGNEIKDLFSEDELKSFKKELVKQVGITEQQAEELVDTGSTSNPYNPTVEEKDKIVEVAKQIKQGGN